MDNSAIGRNWQEARRELFTPEENSVVDIRVSVIVELIKARQELGITQQRLGELTGIEQSSIARLESGNINPTLDTIQKLLAPLGKRLAVIPQ